MQDNFEHASKLYDLNTEHAKRAHDVNRQTSADFGRAAIESANVAIRAFILVNGGAVVALLAFIGAIESSDAGSSASVGELVRPLLAFALGVGFSVVTATLAYLVNMLDHDITNSVKLTWEHPYVVDDGSASRLRWWRNRLHVVAILVAVASLAAFFCGIFSVASAISSLGI
ncbi:hypothetical protein [Leisingera sp. ANG-DT]|uniref:hypothetical protein n=1 Tax=Leisingera sp. ANG-DT TaxID=1577897 RepID=UPI00126A5572|nr:hypothetical protein [Leisingera sp. ANG-DT]